MNVALPTAQSANLYRGSPRQVKYWILRCLQANLVPMLQGPPGVGKSSLIRAIAKEMNLKVIDDRVATNGPEHYSGIPDVSGPKAVYKPFELFPLEGDPLPRDENGKEMAGWLFFMDELNSGLPTTMVGAYKFILEREINQSKVHEKVFIVGAGNRDEDRAIVQALGTAMQSRLIWLEMFLDGNIKEHFDQFMEDVAFPDNWDHRVIAWLYSNKAALNNFDPSHTEKTFSCPRTLEFCSRLSQGYDIIPEDAPLYAGAIGENMGAEFVNFTALFANIPKYEDIILDPLNATRPIETAEQWATISMLSNQVEEPELTNVGDYVDNFPLEFRVLFWRLIQKKKPALRRAKAFQRAQSSIGRYLYGE